MSTSTPINGFSPTFTLPLAVNPPTENEVDTRSSTTLITDTAGWNISFIYSWYSFYSFILHRSYVHTKLSLAYSQQSVILITIDLIIPQSHDISRTTKTRICHFTISIHSNPLTQIGSHKDKGRRLTSQPSTHPLTPDDRRREEGGRGGRDIRMLPFNHFIVYNSFSSHFIHLFQTSTINHELPSLFSSFHLRCFCRSNRSLQASQSANLHWGNVNWTMLWSWAYSLIFKSNPSVQVITRVSCLVTCVIPLPVCAVPWSITRTRQTLQVSLIPPYFYLHHQFSSGPALKGTDCEALYTPVNIIGSDSSPECVSLESRTFLSSH